jgi:death-on-curing protein
MTSTPDDCIHLAVSDVEAIHAAVIGEFGGAEGIRDRSLLESAVAAPRATAFGKSLFKSLPEVAAAYMFYLCRNHPFVDGNKRVAMTSAIVFMRLNGLDPAADSNAWYSLVMEVAGSRIDRAETAKRLRKLVGQVRRPRQSS